jgi:hypothetical protein
LYIKKLLTSLKQLKGINKEIKAAMRRAKKGGVTSIEKLEEEMKLW